MTAVSIRQLTHVYPGGRRALDGLTLDVFPGTLFGVLGPNGGGKTTLFKILSTALRPTSGGVSLSGSDLALRPREARRKIGVVFQNPSVDKKLTVLENVVFQGRLYGLSGETLRGRAEELLRRTGLWDRRTERVDRLSGGLQRRVEIAKGLLHRPEILLLDEPSTGLDPGARRDLWIHLDELTRDGVTVLVTTHLMEEAARCGRLLLLHEGRRVAEGTPSELVAEIGGDVVTITTSDPDRLARDVNERFSAGAAVVDGAVRLERNDGAGFVPRLVEAFPGLVDSITVGKPTLEDVFVRRTGHRFWSEPAETGASAEKRGKG